MKQNAKQVNPPTKKEVLDFIRKGGFCFHKMPRRKGYRQTIFRAFINKALEKVGRGMYSAQA